MTGGTMIRTGMQFHPGGRLRGRPDGHANGMRQATLPRAGRPSRLVGRGDSEYEKETTSIHSGIQENGRH